MLYHVLKNYLFFLLYVIIQVNYGIVSESATEKTVTYSNIEYRSKCTAEKCTCADVPQWNDSYCLQANETSFPELLFNGVKYLPERAFIGLRILAVALFGENDTVAENCFEGILGLDFFQVDRSSIKVIYEFILKVLIFFSSFKIIYFFSF